MFTRIGHVTLAALSETTRVTSLPYAAAKSYFVERRKSRGLLLKSTLTQLYFTAVEPLAFFLTLGLISGLVILVLSVRLLEPTALAQHVPTVVVRAVALEVVPLIIALVLTGRSGTAVATELGYMRVNGEVDALDAAGINIDYFLVLPRLVGITLASVTLTVMMSAAGLFGGYGLGSSLGLLGVALHASDLLDAVHPAVVGVALMKAAFFGITIAAVNCHQGLSVKRVMTEIPRANVRGSVRCYVVCFLVNAMISILVVLRG